MALDTSAFNECLTEVLPVVDAEVGVIGRMPGVRPLDINVTDLLWAQVGHADVVGEKGQKDSTAASVTDVETIRLKLVHGMRFSDEVERSEIGREVLADIAAAFAADIPQSVDQVILHAVNPSTGVAPIVAKNASALTGKGIVSNANSVEVTTTIEAALNSAIAGLPKARGIALSNQAMAELASATNTNGDFRFPQVTPDGDFNYRWLRAAVATSVGNVGDTEIDTDVRAVVGDWTNLSRGVNFISSEVIRYGDPDGLGDLKRTNEAYLRLEYEVVFGVRDYKAFTAVVDEVSV